MKELNYLEAITGERWTGVRFLDQPCVVTGNTFRFCGAIAHSFTEDLTLSYEDIECLGALRSLGCADNDERLALHITRETGIKDSRIRRIISESPRIKKATRSVKLGRITGSEVYVSYLQPGPAMKLLRQWQQVYGRCLSVNMSGFMAVCSAVASAYDDRKIVFSLGCPESRQYGGLTPDQMVAALPTTIVTALMREDTHANV